MPPTICPVDGCDNAIPVLMIPGQPPLFECPTHKIQQYIQTIQNAQKQIAARGGVFHSRLLRLDSEEHSASGRVEVLNPAHKYLMRLMRTVKIELINTVERLREAESQGELENDNEQKTVREAIDLFEKKQDDVCHVPGEECPKAQALMAKRMMRELIQVLGRIFEEEGWIDEDGRLTYLEDRVVIFKKKKKKKRARDSQAQHPQESAQGANDKAYMNTDPRQDAGEGTCNPQKKRERLSIRLLCNDGSDDNQLAPTSMQRSTHGLLKQGSSKSYQMTSNSYRVAVTGSGPKAGLPVKVGLPTFSSKSASTPTRSSLKRKCSAANTSPRKKVTFTPSATVCPDSLVFYNFPPAWNLTPNLAFLSFSLISPRLIQSTTPSQMPHHSVTDATTRRDRHEFKRHTRAYQPGMWASIRGFEKANTSGFKKAPKHMEEYYEMWDTEEAEQQVLMDKLRAVSGTWVLRRAFYTAVWSWTREFTRGNTMGR